MAKDLAVTKFAIHSDSQLIFTQTTEEYMAKHPRMTQYLEKVRKQLKAYQTYAFTQFLRADNAHVNALAGLGSALDHQLKRSIPVEYLDKPTLQADTNTVCHLAILADESLAVHAAGNRPGRTYAGCY